MEDGKLLAETAMAGNDPSSRTTTDLIHADDLMLDLAFPLTDSDFAAPSPSLDQPPDAPATRAADWFLAPETWRIAHGPDPSAPMPIGTATMKKYVAGLQSWFERWVSTGSSPLIHPRLYSANSPPCVQVAYATLASYIHRNSANTDMVLQIVEDRSNELLLRAEEKGPSPDRGSGQVEEWAADDDGGGREQEDGANDLFAQLTRLHALLVYQIIGLFDGDIRARYIAESHMAISDRWASQLLHSAGTEAAWSTHTTIHTSVAASTFSQQQWYLWILSESIRRAWLVAVSLSSVFTALQQRWAACPGGIMYTNRSGLWDAATATAWEKRCFSGGWNGASLQSFGCAKFFDDAEPADIDEFGQAMLDMSCHGELLERWRDRSGG